MKNTQSQTGPKKIFGMIFLFAAILLTLALIGQIPALFKSFSDLIRLFSGETGSYEKGEIVGSAIYWAVHIFLSILLWIIGRKWSKKIVAK